MLAYVIRRLWQMIPTMLGVVLLIFILFNWVGGDPAYILAGKMSNPEQIENIRKQLGVDQPYYVQLWIFIKQILTFDYGASWSTGEPVSQIILTRLGPSLTLLIPLTILQTDEKGKYVYVIATENGKKIARKKPVQVGEIYGDNIEVKGGLTVGDQVITEGFQSLYEGQVVTTS